MVNRVAGALTRRQVLGALGAGATSALAGCSGGGTDRRVFSMERTADTTLALSDAVHVFESASLSGSGYLWVLDPAAGELADEVGGLGICRLQCTDGRRSYYAGDAELFALDAAGEDLWRTDLPQETAATAGAEGAVATLQADGALAVYDGASGDRRNRVTVDEWNGTFGIAATGLLAGDERGFVVVNTDEDNEAARLFGFDHQGTRQWQTRAPWRIYNASTGSIATTTDHILVEEDGAIHVHDRGGSHRWSIDIETEPRGRGATDISLGADSLYAPATNDGLAAYDLADGTERWASIPGGVGVAGGGGVVAAPEGPYVASPDTVFSLDVDGETRWEQEGAGGYELRLGPEHVIAVGDGTTIIERD